MAKLIELSIALNAQIAQFASQMGAASREAESFGNAVKEASRAAQMQEVLAQRRTVGEIARAYAEARQHASELGKALAEPPQPSAAMQREFDRVRATVHRTRDALQSQRAELHRMEHAAGVAGQSLQQIMQGERDLAEAADRAREAIERQRQRGAAFDRIRQNAPIAQEAARHAGAVSMKSVKDAISFETTMADAAKTIDGMRDDTGKLTEKYHEMGRAVQEMGRSIPLTHAEIAALFAAGGQQGLTDVGELQKFATMAAHMSVAWLSS